MTYEITHQHVKEVTIQFDRRAGAHLGHFTTIVINDRGLFTR
jgi:hypothetical protein